MISIYYCFEKSINTTFNLPDGKMPLGDTIPVVGNGTRPYVHTNSNVQGMIALGGGYPSTVITTMDAGNQSFELYFGNNNNKNTGLIVDLSSEINAIIKY